MGYRCVVHDGPAGQRQCVRQGVGGAGELSRDECADGAPGIEQLGDLAGL